MRRRDTAVCHGKGGAEGLRDNRPRLPVDIGDLYIAVDPDTKLAAQGIHLIWWQTPEGVPSTSTGGSAYHYRDNRVHYFLTHPSELTAVGGLAVVFGNGAQNQTNITTDGGQFQQLDAQYMAAPAALP